MPESFQQHTRGRVLVAKIPDHVAIGLDRNPLRYQIFLNHFDQIVALDILRGGTRRDTLRVEIRLTAKLIDPLSEKVEMLLLIFRVLGCGNAADLSDSLLDTTCSILPRRNNDNISVRTTGLTGLTGLTRLQGFDAGIIQPM